MFGSERGSENSTKLQHGGSKYDSRSPRGDLAHPRGCALRIETILCSAYVRFWHKADIARLSSNVRFWG